MKNSYWLEFLEDWGDCAGGYLLGIAVMSNNPILGLIGIAIVLGAVLLKQYHKPQNPES